MNGYGPRCSHTISKFHILYYVFLIVITNSAGKMCRKIDRATDTNQWCQRNNNEYLFSIRNSLVTWFNAVTICRSYGMSTVCDSN